MGRLSFLALAASLVAAPAFAGGVRILDATGDAYYLDIHTAIQDAPDGSVLLVTPGTYAGFTITGKSLSIFGLPGGVVIETPIVVTGLSASQTVVLSGLTVDVYGMATPLTVDSNAGLVRADRCSFIAEDLWPPFAPESPQYPGARGAFVSGGLVAFTRCTLRGGMGEGVDPECTTCGPAMGGGHGLEANAETVALYDALFGGDGGGSPSGTAARGGDGLRLNAGTAFVSGSSVRGGHGGQDFSFPYTCGGFGGNGCTNFGTLHQIGSSFQAGSAGGSACGGPGVPIGGFPANNIPGPARKLTLLDPVVSGDTTAWSATYSGAPGEHAFLFASLTPRVKLSLPFHGTWLVFRAELLPAQDIGITGPSGTITTSIPTPNLPSGSGFQRRFEQAVVRSAGSVYLGTGSVQILIDRDSSPDCDGNGVNDFVQVIENPGQDADGDLHPDTCPQYAGPTWYVDAAAPSGGDGSSAAPFRRLLDAFTRAQNAHTVLVADGTYTGPANRNLEFGSRGFTVKSTGGPSACIIDCEGDGRAFSRMQSAPAAVRIEGLTIRNGNSANGAPGTPTNSGGAIYTQGSASSYAIVDCVFENCDSQYSSTVTAGSFPAGPFELRRCVFVGNTGGGATLLGGPITVEDCRFEDNAGVGLYLRSGNGAHTVSRCRIAGNGPGMLWDAQNGNQSVRVQDCLFEENSNPSPSVGKGGGLHSNPYGSTPIAVLNCTFVSNHAGSEGGGLYAESGTATVANCVFWGNTAPFRPQISNIGGVLRYSDVEGGASGTQVLALDPLFVDPDGADDDPTTFGDNDYRLTIASPCIDAGENANASTGLVDLGGVPRFQDVPTVPDTGAGSPPIVDMGCHERQP